ncbi:MAG: hypothetical protein DI536_15185 [Archangium gephyra]|uniref:STAS/SEC14 domain-containing protein n=1 Tax=Archangium gephyra TaxID=48 RepID=A0A2W5T9T0_9BACT|nr:MAG: hypothetical protein DI536_15185 [Archangium gephyra]
MLVTLLYQSERVRFGAAGSVILMQYRLPPTLEELKVVEVYEDQLLMQYAKISVFTVSERTNTLLRVPEDVRDYSAELSRKYGSRVIGSAMVVSETGLAAAMVRTFLAGFLLLTRGALNLRSFRELNEALTWLRSLPEQDIRVKTELTLTDLERFFSAPFPTAP